VKRCITVDATRSLFRKGGASEDLGCGPEALPFGRQRPGRDEMRGMITRKAKAGGLVAVKVLCFVALVGSALTVWPQAAFAATSSDDFTRSNGSLGANWTDMSVGGLAISDDAVIGTQAAGNSGDIYSGSTFGSDQFSQIETTSTQLSGDQWIGPAVRAQDGGQDLYVGIYWWNNGSQALMLFKLLNGSWTLLGATPSGPLAAGTVLNLSVTGSALSFSENGVTEVTATDTTLSGGAPAIMAYGTPTGGTWSGGDGTSPQPSDDAPEAPMVVLFPVVAFGLLAVFVIHRRRRTSPE
jgi:hypothetical protein